MEHQIFNKCGNTYYTIQEISTEKRKKRKTFSGTKEPYYNLSSPVITLTYWRYVAVRKKKKESLSQAQENEKQMAAKLLLSGRKLIADWWFLVNVFSQALLNVYVDFFKLAWVNHNKEANIDGFL